MDQVFAEAANFVLTRSSNKQTTEDGAEILTLAETEVVQSHEGTQERHKDAPLQQLQQPLLSAAAAGWRMQHSNNSNLTGGGSGVSMDDLRFDFIHAAQTGDCEQLQTIIGMKMDVNVTDADGYPALTLASCYGFTSCVALLLECEDIDVDMPANDGCTALQVAAQDSFDAIVKLLIDSKADVDLCSTGAASPLFLAAQEGEQEADRLRRFLHLHVCRVKRVSVFGNIHRPCTHRRISGGVEGLC